ncbi:MAG: hypothetical protein DBP03_18985 [gamma proteobacterium symbiont of Ctena orbiculata]|nr:MAG: hypothetical protein DBP03_18985 [gamma proteobacterium symbiont of Ctena orbiculata]
MIRANLTNPSFRPIPEKWRRDAPFTDLRMESMCLIFRDPGMRRDDEERINQGLHRFNCDQNILFLFAFICGHFHKQN